MSISATGSRFATAVRSVLGRARTALAAGLLVLGAASAQVGFKDVSLPNPTRQGTKDLLCRIYYPSDRSGSAAPLSETSNGHPTLVFLHGWTALGRWYPEIGRSFAAAGYVVVLSDTAQFWSNFQLADGIALYHALRRANDGDGFLANAIDVDRIGIFGHSMGGGNALRILADNPGYACGLALAPVGAPSVAAKIRTPLALLHGEDDTIMKWKINSQATFDAATGFRGIKSLHLFDSRASHNNIAGYGLRTAQDRAVWKASLKIMRSFFDRYLRDDTRALEGAFAPRAPNTGHVTRLQVRVRTPELWALNHARIGRTFELRLLAEPGFAALFSSTGTSSIETHLGRLQLDPTALEYVNLGVVGDSRRLRMSIEVPANPALVGKRYWLQGLGHTVARDPQRGRRFSATTVEAPVAR